jgi:predicted DNA-binding transcriptional regulator YafY
MPKVALTLTTRPPIERMMQIHSLLQKRKFPNCTTIGKSLEISTRTVKRDIDFMKYRMDLPIEFHARRNGYFYSEPVEHFPSVSVSESELFALLIAHKAVAQYHGTPFEAPLRTAFQKLNGGLNQEKSFELGGSILSFRPFAPDDPNLKSFEILTEALRQRRAVRFSYRKLGEKSREPRQVHPYHLACIENQWYLIAFDLQRQAIRNFALSRLTDAKADTARFRVPKDFDAKKYLDGGFSAFVGKDDFEVVIHFDTWAADLIGTRKVHHSQEITPLPSEAGIRVHFRLNNIEEIERWVLSWGVHATVIRPEKLIDRLRTITAELNSRYSEPARAPKRASPKRAPAFPF